MNVRKTRLAAALLAVGALAGGCGIAESVTTPTATPASSAPPEPREQLLDAVPGATAGAFAFRIEGGTQPMRGVLDAANKRLRIDLAHKDPELGFTITMNFLVVQERSWIKVAVKGAEGLTGMPDLPKKWMSLDPDKIKDKDAAPLAYDGETDPGEVGAVLRAIVDVKQTGTGKYAGTTDLSRQGEAEIVDEATLAALGDRAEAVPFEATVDGQGRLTSMIVRIPAAGKAKASRYEVTYDGYGSTDSPSEPAADKQQPATEEAYEMVNS
ncbi:hypothetical protein AB0M36_15805 [Actinoplanes sp. NPDC051346]|uniref:hypothetical protein n=1 Tax=Actinoplanes sp. NPDC051346 TaxID=3155048 RepID=UPI00341A8F6F